jgi:hypothetical protein
VRRYLIAAGAGFACGAGATLIGSALGQTPEMSVAFVALILALWAVLELQKEGGE